MGFRVDKARGRALWTWEGREYTKYFLPPNLRDTEFTPFGLDCEMHHAGVDAVLLHTDPALVRDSSYLGEIVRRFPGRIFSMAPVDEWRIIAETDAVIAETVGAVEKDGLHAVKFIPPLCYLAGDQAWDDGPYRPFWEAVVGLGVPIFFTLGAGPGDFEGGRRSSREEQRGYLGEHRILMRWMERYPDAVCSLTHGFPWRTFLDDGNKAIGLAGRDMGAVHRRELPPRGVLPRAPGGHLRLSLPRSVADPGRDGGTHRRRSPSLGHRHAVPEPLLHLPPVAQVDRGPLRAMVRTRSQ